MSATITPAARRYSLQKVFCWLLLLGLFLLLTRIGVRHYFREEAVKAGTLPVTVGRVIALWTIALLLLQPILAARLRVLDRIFGLDRLLRFHRLAGILSLSMACFHPLLMYVSGLKKLGPLSSEQWPEAIGSICIVGLWLAVVSSVWRRFVSLNYEQWLRLHKFTAPVVVLALAHMFIIESAMLKGWVLGFWVVLLVLWAAVLLASRIVFPAQRARNEAFVVAESARVAEGVWQLNLKPDAGVERFDFVPGQFAFLAIKSPEIPFEEHPFTIASAPADAGNLQFIIKGDGDWTRKLSAVRAGDQARVSGPFGVFSAYRHEPRSLVMIAGGIGITPMLSTLRQLSREKAALPVKLIWSFQTRAGAPCIDEIDGFRQALPNLEVIKIATREPAIGNSAPTRLDKLTLAKLLPEFKPGDLVMLCGPVPMMREVRHILQSLNYPDSAVLSEEFAL
ncbi:MAG TPA: ferric reductase-like transmembrane domain-containing protein [Candidatus Rifleibacterium sp.]|nr:ferric reductase-like transmembrane domain-containing protein [Candidatus Rifleibacterium sp.]HPT48472.1 ferric reductase-like transmembrane domain-containing protein [Candidatus Rifleibacterium sp.]